MFKVPNFNLHKFCAEEPAFAYWEIAKTPERMAAPPVTKGFPFACFERSFIFNLEVLSKMKFSLK